MPFFHVCPKSACCSCVCHDWLAQSTFHFLLFFCSTFLYGLPYLGTGPCLIVGFAFHQPTIFSATISCHTTLSFLLRNCLPQSCWAPLGMPFILLPMASMTIYFLLLHSRALVPHLFSHGCPSPFAFIGLTKRACDVNDKPTKKSAKNKKGVHSKRACWTAISDKPSKKN